MRRRWQNRRFKNKVSPAPHLKCKTFFFSKGHINCFPTHANNSLIHRDQEGNPNLRPTNLEKLRFVCATRETEDGFFKNTLLGRTLKLFECLPMIELELSPENTRGLPEIYNEAIENSKNNPAILLFAHDDIQIPDIYFPNHIHLAMAHFDIAGIAGNIRRLPGQPSWCFATFQDNTLINDEKSNLSGVVMHGDRFPECAVSYFGRPGKTVKLLDGLLLIARSETLHKNDLRFDPIFKFHFYDMDFCRQAEARALRMGTCPLSVIHASRGNYASKSWKTAYLAYLDKYNDDLTDNSR